MRLAHTCDETAAALVVVAVITVLVFYVVVVALCPVCPSDKRAPWFCPVDKADKEEMKPPAGGGGAGRGPAPAAGRRSRIGQEGGGGTPCATRRAGRRAARRGVGTRAKETKPRDRRGRRAGGAARAGARGHLAPCPVRTGEGTVCVAQAASVGCAHTSFPRPLPTSSPPEPEPELALRATRLRRRRRGGCGVGGEARACVVSSTPLLAPSPLAGSAGGCGARERLGQEEARTGRVQGGMGVAGGRRGSRKHGPGGGGGGG